MQYRRLARSFLPLPPSRRLLRFGVLFTGLILFGIAVCLMVRADLGLDPWNVLHAGIAMRTGLTIGQATILVGAVVVALWIPLGVRIGIGSVINVISVGLVADFCLWLIPPFSDPALRSVLLCLAIVCAAVGCAIYLAAGLGAGPRDGLMLGLRDRGVGALWVVRTGMEVAALAVGWVLGGTVGIGTLVYAVGFGPLLHVAIPYVSLDSRRA